MDCEKFDQVLIDALYDELDELTVAALQRHTDACPRCQATWHGLRATRKVGTMPIVDAPDSIEPRILAAAREASRNLPWPRRIGRAISWAGAYAMRPQTAMAALLLLMLGSSLLLIRAKPDRSGLSSHVSVTERGVPERAPEEFAVVRTAPSLAARPALPQALPPPQPSPPAAVNAPSPREEEVASPEAKAALAPPPAPIAPGPAAAQAERPIPGQPSDDRVAARTDPGTKTSGPAGSDAYAAAMALYSAGRFVEAERAFATIAASSDRNAPSAALFAARSTEANQGCSNAAPKFEAAASRFPHTSAGAEAQWGAANCYKTIGRTEKARSLYLELRSVAGYRDRAEAELASLGAVAPPPTAGIPPARAAARARPPAASVPAPR